MCDVVVISYNLKLFIYYTLTKEQRSCGTEGKISISLHSVEIISISTILDVFLVYKDVAVLAQKIEQFYLSKRLFDVRLGYYLLFSEKIQIETFQLHLLLYKSETFTNFYFVMNRSEQSCPSVG